MTSSKKSFFALAILGAVLAVPAFAQAQEQMCYRGAKVPVMVDGVERFGTQVLCNNQVVRIELDASPVSQYYPQQAPVYQVVPQPVYVVPPAYYRPPPSTVYLNGNGAGVIVGVPGLYINYGYRPYYQPHYYHGGHHH